MPIDTQQRKTLVDLSEQNASNPVLPIVAQQQNARAYQVDTSQVVSALENWGQSLDRHAMLRARNEGRIAQQQQKKADQINSVKGARDAQLGQFDESLASQSEAYANARQEGLGTLKGLASYNDAKDELEQNIKLNPNFDFEAWNREKMAKLYEGVDDPNQLASLNKMAGMFQNNLRGEYQAKLAAHQHADAMNIAGGIMWQGINAGVKSPKDIDALSSEVQKLGLDDEERNQVLGSALVNKIESGDGSLYKHLVSGGNDILNDGKYGPAIQHAEQMRIKRAEAEARARQQEDTIGKLQTMIELGNKADLGQLSMGDLEAAQKKGFHSANLYSYYEKNQKSLSEQSADYELRTAVTQSLQAGKLQELKGDEKKYKAATDVIDGEVSKALQARTAAVGSGDPKAQAQAEQTISSMVSLAQSNSYFPAPMKAKFENVDPSNKAWADNLTDYIQMKRSPSFSFLSANISGEAKARYDRGAYEVEALGKPVEQVRQELAAAPQVTKQAASEMLAKPSAQAGKTRVVRDIVGNGNTEPVVRSRIGEYLVANIMAGVPDSAALDRAKAQFERDHIVTKDAVFSKRNGMPDNMGSIMDDWRRNVLGPKVKEALGNEGGSWRDYTILPVQGEPDKVQLVPLNAGARLRNKDVPGLAAPGSHPEGFLTIDWRQLVRESADAKAADVAKARHAADETVDTYQRSFGK